MVTNNTTRVSFRLRTDVYLLVRKRSAQVGIDVSAFMQEALMRSIYEDMPEELRCELENTKTLFELAQAKAREVCDAGQFDEHFTLTVFRELMKGKETRKLYEDIIGVDAYTSGATKKMPLNMYLCWYIKNAINAEPIVDEGGKARRAFVKDEPIKSYTLLAVN